MNHYSDLTIQYAAFVMSLISQVSDVCTLIFAPNIKKNIRVVAALSIVVCCSLCAIWVLSARVVVFAPPLPAATQPLPPMVELLQQTMVQSPATADVEPPRTTRDAPEVLLEVTEDQAAETPQADVVPDARLAPMPSLPYLSAGPTQPDDVQEGDKGRSANSDDSVNAAGGEPPKDEASKKESVTFVGNLITCAPANGWIKLYRLDDRHQWVSMGNGIGSIHPTGAIQIPGLPVDVSRYGGRGEPYRIEAWQADGKLAHSTGDFLAGEPEFRLYPSIDNATPWGCPPL